MALQTSGAISLGDIHVEAAGSGYAFSSISSLNDADIRGLIGSTAGTTVSFSNFYGASSTDTQTVTVGRYYDGTAYVPTDNYGFSLTFGGGFGSISDGTLSLTGNTTIKDIRWNNLVPEIYLQLSAIVPNSGWTTMTIAGSALSRSSASFSQSSGITTWKWTSANLFGTTVGATKSVVFT